MKNALLLAAGALAAIILVPLVIILSGAVDLAADTPHSAATSTLLETARERSIATHIRGVEVPPLSDPAAVRRGAGNYDSMCTECHLAPGRPDTELSSGLYPAPPNLSRGEPIDPARAYWIIKHGIKATGMPAWGKSMEDRYVWDMVALLQVLPRMSADQYAQEVMESGGHSHGGSETTEHSPEESTQQSHDEAIAEGTSTSGHEHSGDAHADEPAPRASDSAKAVTPEMRVHTHKDGSQHEH